MNKKCLGIGIGAFLFVFLAGSFLVTASIATHKSAYAVTGARTIGPVPSWALPYAAGTSISIGFLGLHDDNFSAITDDTSGAQTYFFTNQTDPDALDFVLQPSALGTASIPTMPLASGKVLAVQSACHVVLIDHGAGWWAVYVHLANIAVKAGQVVKVNTILGYANTQNLGCGEVSTAEHTHVSIVNATGNHQGKYVSLLNQYLCGHQVLEHTPGDTNSVYLDGVVDSKDVAFTVPKCLPKGPGGNLWITGHDPDYHCTFQALQCHYLQVAVNFVMNGSTLPILALDHGTEVKRAINKAFGIRAPLIQTINPRKGFASVQLVDSNGLPNYSAIVVASDYTCGGCDNNLTTTGIGTPDSDAINARINDIINFFNARGGILALAGADNSDVYYNFVPYLTTAVITNPPYTLTSLGVSLGLVEGNDDNCCPTHNSFDELNSSLIYQVAETDAISNAETMITTGISSAALHHVIPSYPVRHPLKTKQN